MQIQNPLTSLISQDSSISCTPIIHEPSILNFSQVGPGLVQLTDSLKPVLYFPLYHLVIMQRLPFIAKSKQTCAD